MLLQTDRRPAPGPRPSESNRMIDPRPVLRLLRRAFALAAAAAVIVGPLLAQAKEAALLGVWSTTIAGAGGPSVAISLGFGADSSLEQHIDAAGSVTFYSGVYSLAPNGMLAYRIDDYVPKMRCTGAACKLVQPAMPIGRVLSARIDSVGKSSFIFIEAKETHIFKRQR